MGKGIHLGEYGSCPYCDEWFARSNNGILYCIQDKDCPNYGEYYKDENKENNSIVHPSHYNRLPNIECMDVVKYFDFVLGNVIKYILRSGYKKTTTKLEDLQKAKYYLNIAIEMEKNNELVSR